MKVSELTDWCYLSGVVAVKETNLLGKEFFEDLLGAADVSHLRDIFGKTLYAQYLGTSPTRARYLESLDRLFEEESNYLRRISPEPLPFLWHEFHSRFRRVRSALSMRRNPDEEKAFLREAMKDLSGFLLAEDVLPELAIHFEKLEDTGLFEIPRSDGISNLLDSFALALLGRWRAGLLSLPIQRFLENFINIRTGEVIYRSLSRKVSPQNIERFFLIGKVSNDEVSLWLRGGAEEPRQVFAFYLPYDLWKALEELPKDEFEERLEVEADNVLMDILSEARRTPFGPEKVFGYLRALEIQNLNTRVALAAVIDGVEKEVVRRRLREVYV